VVVATGTASGKSLAYQLPVLERLLADDRSVALYLAPTKALAHDQLRTIRGLKLPQVRAAVLDGDTPTAGARGDPPHRQLGPDQPRPAAPLAAADHRTLGGPAAPAAVVVVDESHVARGVFGSHVALVLRRLRRLAERYGATRRSCWRARRSATRPSTPAG
jgi:DEAD/DEAH box helicase domain-containing protein